MALTLAVLGGAVGLYLALNVDPAPELVQTPSDEGETAAPRGPIEIEDIDFVPAQARTAELPPVVDEGDLTDARIRRIRGNILTGGNDLRIAMRQLIALGPEGALLIPDLEKVIAEYRESDRRMAMVAIMAVEGSRRYMRELASVEVEHPTRKGLVDLADPVAGQALKAAMRLARAEPPILGMKRVAELLCEDPVAAATVIAERLLDAPPGDLAGWIEVIRGYRPPPAELGDALARCLTTEDVPRGRAVIEVLGDHETDLGPLTDVLLDPLLRRLERSADVAPSVRPALLRALGNLDTDDPRVIGRLELSLREGPPERAAATLSLQKLGRNAATAVDGLVEIYPKAGNLRTITLRALLATGSEEAMPLFLKVINTRWHGSTDILDVLEKLPEIDGAAAALPALRARYASYTSSLRGKAAICAARIDPALESKDTVTILVWALRHGLAPTRASASHAVKQLERLTPEVAGALIQMSEREKREDRKSAVGAMKTLALRGVDVRACLPALETLTDDLHLKMDAMVAVAAIDTSLPIFRKEVEEMASSVSGRQRRSAVWLLGRLPAPGPGDVALLRSILASKGGEFRDARRYAKKLLETPLWQRAAAGL